MVDLSSLADPNHDPTPSDSPIKNTSLLDLISPNTPDDMNTSMAEKRAISVRRRQIHSIIRQRLKEGEVDIQGLLVQAVFDADIQTMRLIIILTALPKVTKDRATEILKESNLPVTRRLGWLATHPKMSAKFLDVVQKHMEIVNPQPRALPNPNWPWRDDE